MVVIGPAAALTAGAAVVARAAVAGATADDMEASGTVLGEATTSAVAGAAGSPLAGAAESASAAFFLQDDGSGLSKPR